MYGKGEQKNMWAVNWAVVGGMERAKRTSNKKAAGISVTATPLLGNPLEEKGIGR